MEWALQRKTLLEKTKKAIAESVGEDIVIIQTLQTVDDLTVQLNHLTKRLREWHAYFLPELQRAVDDNEAYARLIATTPYAQLQKKYVSDVAMGSIPNSTDGVMVESLAQQITQLYQFKTSLLHYLDARCTALMPNVAFLAGTTIAARLLAGAGSLRQLSRMPASTIQMLGAEKALFRHLKTGAKPPKYGHIINHQILQQAKPAQRGKLARGLADKLAICAKVDYFKGEFIADTYKKQLEARIQ